MKRLRILAALLCVLAAPAYAQVQGQDYELLTPAQPTSSPDKVEIIEGLQPGDQVILSDMSAQDSYDRIRISG